MTDINSQYFIFIPTSKTFAEPYKNSLWIENEMKKNVAIAWDARRLIVKSGSLLKTKHTNNKWKNQQVFLMLFWSIYLNGENERLYGTETLQNKAIRYLFNLIHNSSSTPSPYNVRGKQIKMKWKRSSLRNFASLKHNWFYFFSLNDDLMLIQFIKR